MNGTSIKTEDFIIGKQQLFFTFLHELMHAFITNKAVWIHDLDDDEVDFVNEVIVRVLIDFVIQEFDLKDKVNPYYEVFIHHENDLKVYGHNLEPEAYRSLEKIWYKEYRETLDIDDYCSYVLLYIRQNVSEKRDVEMMDKVGLKVILLTGKREVSKKRE